VIARLIERAARRVARRGMLAARSGFLRMTHASGLVSQELDPSAVERILAVRLDRLGDLVLTLPAIDDLAVAYPNAHRVMMVPPAHAPLLRGRPAVHRVVAAEHDGDVGALALGIAAVEPDLAVDFSPVDDLRAARAMALARVPARVGLAGGGREVYFTKTASPGHRSRPLIETNGLVVDAAGGIASAVAPRLEVDRDSGIEAEGLLRQLGAPSGWPRIAVHPGGYYPSQRWPVDRFADVAVALAARHTGKVVILGGPGEDELVRALHRFGADHSVMVPAVDVASLAAVLSRCDILIANNSGPLHLAGAVGLATVSIMGPTDPVRFWPMGVEQTVLRRRDLACSPCARGRCGPHDCLEGITVSEVLDAAQELLDAALARRRGTEVGVPT
jgi:ADP-heptose:LPS heptosyltransferase